MQSRSLTRPESTCPMRFFQLTSKTRLVAGDASECEEAILKVTRQKATVLQVLDRLSLGVQQPLYSLDDFIAMGQEQLEKFDMRVKRHLARTLCGWPLFRCKERKSQASKQFANHDAPPSLTLKRQPRPHNSRVTPSYGLNDDVNRLRTCAAIASVPLSVLPKTTRT